MSHPMTIVVELQRTESRRQPAIGSTQFMTINKGNSQGMSKTKYTLIDLSGNQYGRLSVLSYAGRRYWNCRCECGSEKQIRADHLKDGRVRSCGCLVQAEDLTGRKYGEWHVIERRGNLPTGSPLFLCRCSCGSEVIHQASNLKSGNTESCGCMGIEDYSGQRYGRLVLVAHINDSGKATKWIAKCDCGSEKVLLVSNVVSGKTKSCGCLQREETSKRAKVTSVKHGKSKARVYTIYRGMLDRCTNPSTASYRLYGGAGVRVCDDWLYSFENFYRDMGDPPSSTHSLDRYGNQRPLPYSKETCRWATPKEQANNRDSCRYVVVNGVKKTCSEWSDTTRVPAQTIARRLNSGWCESCSVSIAPRAGTCSHKKKRAA